MSINYREEFHQLTTGEAKLPYLVSAWQHLVGYEYGAETFAQATVEFVKKWDWQWVKINPRGIYFSEAWGATYNPDDYRGSVTPIRTSQPYQQLAEIEQVSPIDALNNPVFAEQLAAARLIRKALPHKALLDTIFVPLAVLLQIAGIPANRDDQAAKSRLDRKQYVIGQEEKAHLALKNITQALSEYAQALVRPLNEGGAGLDGIFFALTGTISQDYFTAEEYQRFSLPYEQQLIEAVKAANPEAKILLHTCRADSHPDWFTSREGVDFLQWDPFLANNPDLGDLPGPVPVGGAEAVSFADGKHSTQIKTQLQQTVTQLKGRPFLLSPSCAVPSPSSDINLRQLAESRVDESGF